MYILIRNKIYQNLNFLSSQLTTEQVFSSVDGAEESSAMLTCQQPDRVALAMAR